MRDIDSHAPIETIIAHRRDAESFNGPYIPPIIRASRLVGNEVWKAEILMTMLAWRLGTRSRHHAASNSAMPWVKDDDSTCE
jgi:hypothetical protein